MTSTHATFARLVGRTATAPKSFDEFREVMMDGSSRSVVYTSDKAMSSVKELVQLEEAVRATSVQKLTLKKFRFVEPAIIALCMGLESPVCQLRTLEMVRLNLSADHAIALSKALHSNKRISRLSLAHNTIGSLGAVALAAAMKVNKGLTDVDANFIDDYGAIALAEMLESNWTVLYLRLDRNQIDSTGAEHFLRALPLNLSLFTLSLSDNRIPRLLKTRLTKMLERKAARQKVASEAFYTALGCEAGVPWMQNKVIFVGDEDSGRGQVVDILGGITSSASEPQPRESEKPNDRMMHYSRGVEITDGADVWTPFEVFSHFHTRVPETAAMLGLREFERVRERHVERVEKNEPVSQQKSSSTTTSSIASKAKSTELTAEGETAVEEEEARLTALKGMFTFDAEEMISAYFERYTMYVTLWEFSNGIYFNPCMSHLFFQGGFVFVVVFDIIRFNDPKPNRAASAKQRLCRWLEQIQAHSPRSRVFVVGTLGQNDRIPTHLASGGERAMMQATDAEIQQIASKVELHVEESPGGLSFWPVVLGDEEPPLPLRRALTLTLREHNFTNLCMPLKWVKALEVVLSHGKDDAPILPLKDLRDRLNIFGETSMDELESMLAVFNKLGAVMYSKRSHCLRESVVTSPRWLFEQVRKLESIVIGQDEKELGELEKAGLLQDQAMLLSSGVATKDLLEHLWKGKQNHGDVILQFLIAIGFAGEWKSAEGDTTYLLPTMSTHKPMQLLATGALYALRFRFLPEGVYPKLVSQFIATLPFISDKCAPVLQHRSSTFWLSEVNAVVIRLASDDTIEVAVQDAKKAGETLQAVEAVLKRVKDQDALNLRWETFVKLDGAFVQVKQEKPRMWSASTGTSGSALDMFEDII